MNTTNPAALRARLRELEGLRSRVAVEILAVQAALVAHQPPGPVRQRRSRHTPPPCGTEAGYQRHRYQAMLDGGKGWPLPLEDPCGCRAGHRRHKRLRSEARLDADHRVVA